MRTLLVLSSSFELVARLRREFGEDVALARHARVHEAVAALAAQLPLAVLLEPLDARGTSSLALFAAARRADPTMPVVALVRRSTGWSAATIALLEAQPTAVFVEEDLDLRAVSRLLVERVGRAAFVSRVWAELGDEVPQALRPLVRHALSRAGAPLRVVSVAEELGLHRKTLWSHCRRHGVASVRGMMTWCRLLAATHALRASARAIDIVAEDLAFPSPTAMRNAIRRHLGVTATRLRAPDGERLACDAFRRWLRGARAPHETIGDVA